MELFFFRHGEAEPPGATATDDERQLTDIGRDDTRLVAAALQRAGMVFDGLLSSPLIRARQTSEILAEALGLQVQVTDGLRSGAELGGIQRLLAERPGQRTLLVGHEPDLSRMIAQLIGGGRIRMGTSAVACVQMDRIEPGAGRLMWLVTPEVLPAG
ncbi:MAG: phosphohistidine phosphatase SixA [Armatimonadota bacterium]|jgi:phosphohistidine phosphatase